MYERKKRSGIMLCYPFEEKRLDKWNTPYLVQPKLDGVRCRAVKTVNGFLLLSSTEEVIFSVPHINDYLNAKINSLPNELDGELYNHDMTFEQIYSITSRTTNLHPSHKLIQYHIFDYVSDDPQLSRTANLFSIRAILSHPLHLVPTWATETFDEIISQYHDLTNRNYEGIIVRHFLAPYVKKRSVYMMKFKPKQSDAYKIVGLQEELDKHNNPKNRLGAFICDSGYGDGETFTVGSGLTDSQRVEYWHAGDDLINYYCLVSYQHITPGRKVPRFPVFTRVIDSTEARKYEE